MNPGHALAEDLRRVGVALIVTGLVAGFLEDQVTALTSIGASVVGVGLLIGAYWIHHREHRRSQESGP